MRNPSVHLQISLYLANARFLFYPLVGKMLGLTYLLDYQLLLHMIYRYSIWWKWCALFLGWVWINSNPGKSCHLQRKNNRNAPQSSGSPQCAFAQIFTPADPKTEWNIIFFHWRTMQQWILLLIHHFSVGLFKDFLVFHSEIQIQLMMKSLSS